MTGLTDRPDPLAPPEGYGAKPGSGIPDDQPRDGRCTMGSGQGRCQSAAGYAVWTGCTKGEHVGPSDYCQAHLDTVLQFAGRNQYTCLTCSQAGRGAVPVRVLKIENLETGELVSRETFADPRTEAAIGRLFDGKPPVIPAGRDRFA